MEQQNESPESLETRVKKLEKIVVLQQALIDRLNIVGMGTTKSLRRLRRSWHPAPYRRSQYR